MVKNIIVSPNKTLFVELNPKLGGALTAYYKMTASGRVDLMRPAPDASTDILEVSSFPLTPFSNRIGNGILNFNGKQYKVGPNFRDEPHPNHGDGWTSAWTLDSISDHHARMTLHVSSQPHTPYTYVATQDLELDDNGLQITLSIQNLGHEELPFGLGHHPYFPRTSDVTFKAYLPQIWLSKNMLPTQLIDIPDRWDFSQGRTLNEKNLGIPDQGFGKDCFMDHCLQGWNNRAEITWPSQGVGLSITADPLFSHFVLYIPQANFFCAEPVSHATDAFNLAHQGHQNVGLTILKPQETMTGNMRFDCFFINN